MTFKVGDRVEWTSQAAGCTRTKVGAVVRVLAPREDPGAMSKNRNPGAPRDHESYIVHVKGKGTYWPRVASLRPSAGGVTVSSEGISYRFTVKLSGQPARHYSGNTLEGFNRDLAEACAPATSEGKEPTT